MVQGAGRRELKSERAAWEGHEVSTNKGRNSQDPGSLWKICVLYSSEL